MGQVGQAGHCISPELARVIWSLNLDFKSHPKKKKKKAHDQINIFYFQGE